MDPLRAELARDPDAPPVWSIGRTDARTPDPVSGGCFALPILGRFLGGVFGGPPGPYAASTCWYAYRSLPPLPYRLSLCRDRDRRSSAASAGSPPGAAW